MPLANTVQLSGSVSQQSDSTRRLSIAMGSSPHPRSLHFAFLPLNFRAAPTPFGASPNIRFRAKSPAPQIVAQHPNPSIINTSEKSHFNPSTINTYKNTRLKVVQNQHLQKMGGGTPSRFSTFTRLCSSGRSPRPARRVRPKNVELSR